MSFYESYIGPYPYSEFDIIETKLMAMGMEYPTLVMIRDDAFKRYSRGSRIILHELGHQWFYGILGNDQINNPWLDEGAVTFFERLYIADDNITKVFYQNYESYSEINIEKIIDTPILGNCFLGSSEVNYYKCAYDYSAIMFCEIYMVLNKERFTKLMNTLYNRFKFGIVSKQDFIDACFQIDRESTEEIIIKYLGN